MGRFMLLGIWLRICCVRAAAMCCLRERDDTKCLGDAKLLSCNYAKLCSDVEEDGFMQ